MKRSSFIIVFIVAHIMFACLQIFKQQEFTRRSYKYQKDERYKQELDEKKKTLTNQLFALSNHTDIKKFAHAQLSMEQIHISQVRKLNYDTRV